ncbi:hypothetical protein A3H38_06180 [candidate division WOR-1 bacterium RIFCSPLOWO2_02_FULL_46_20]|uniref:Uncharacterized protein n=2 Tax=Saganbacteria TaxID=1703751 RepID=A0A1F4RBJ7_UNCSA|nr:MAG: hypothetical protein A3H38_06180 [candidate division WOR-1 bacterium RIFCSPLOWO2_02_FULL_46_20]OGC09468.1 MAG: hypothetical protein A3F86_02480 [candidate division WOR-1 bacterium RIFCSPLOWO2_12_FULL_45_9]
MNFFIIVFVCLILILGNFSSPTHGQTMLPPGQQMKMQKIKERIDRLPPRQRGEAIHTLSNKLQRIKQRLREVRDAERRAAIEAEFDRVTRELEFLKAAVEEFSPEQTPGPLPPPPPDRPLNHPMNEPPPRHMGHKPDSRQIGLSAGYVAGLPGALLELRLFEPFDLISTSLRVGGAYAQGADSAGTSRKHVLAVLDGIYRLNPPHTQGIKSYFGLGFNYDVYTSGQQNGTLGGQIFYGIEGGQTMGSQMFFEVGYGLIRTGFSPNQMGLTALLGYKF